MYHHKQSEMSRYAGILLASLAMLGRSGAAPTLCMQPVSQGEPLTTFEYMVPVPGSDSSVGIVDTEGKVYLADLPPPGTSDGLLDLTLLVDLGPRLSSWDGVGIRGLAFHPDFPNTRRMFVSYVCGNGTGNGTDYWPFCNSVSPDGQGPKPYCACDAPGRPCKEQPGSTQGCQNVLVVDEFVVSKTGRLREANKTRVAAIGLAYRDNIGGEILFHPGTSLLYMMTGDGGASLKNASLSQNLSSPLGKVLRMDVDASVDNAHVRREGLLGQYYSPEGNFGNRSVQSAVYAVGLRNPHGCAAYSPEPNVVLCTDMGRDSSNDVVAVDKRANYAWPSCPNNNRSFVDVFWMRSECDDSILSYPASGIQSEPFGGARVVQDGYLGTGGDMCQHRWILYGYDNGTMLGVPEDASRNLNFSGTPVLVTPRCYPSASCKRPSRIVSWMRNPLYKQRDQSDQLFLPYLIADTGIYQVVKPDLCGSPCAPPPQPPPKSPPYQEPPSQGTGSPSAGGTPSSGTPSSGSPSSSGSTDASATPVTTGGQEDANSFLTASGIQGTFDSTYWIKLSAIFGVITVIVCSICCFFIIMGWKEGRKKDQRFLELKQAEADLDERTRDPEEDNMVYQPAGDPDDDGTVYTDEDGTEYDEEMSEDDESMSEYSSRHGPESSSGRSASTRGRRYGDGESDAGTDYTGYTGYTGYSGRSGQTSRTGRSGAYTGTESAVSRSRQGDGMSDSQSYTTRDDWTETASGYGYAYGP